MNNCQTHDGEGEGDGLRWDGVERLRESKPVPGSWVAEESQSNDAGNVRMSSEALWLPCARVDGLGTSEPGVYSTPWNVSSSATQDEE